MEEPSFTRNCPSLTASPASCITPVFVPPVSTQAFVALAAPMSWKHFHHQTLLFIISIVLVEPIKPLLKTSFFLPSSLKFFAPPMMLSTKWGVGLVKDSIALILRWEAFQSTPGQTPVLCQQFLHLPHVRLRSKSDVFRSLWEGTVEGDRAVGVGWEGLHR